MNEHDSYEYEDWPPQPRAPWPAPEASARVALDDGSRHRAHRRRVTRRRRALAAAIAAAAIIAGSAAYVSTNRSPTSSVSAPPAASAAPTTAPAPVTTPAPSSTDAPSSTGAPSTSPPTTGADGSAGTGTGGPSAAATSITALSVGVVDIDTILAYQGGAAAGTGLVLSADGEILTNNHVVDGATTITVTVVSTGKSYAAEVVGTDPTADVAVLKLKNASGLAVARIGDSSTVNIGDAVIAAGNAGGVGGAPTVARGVVLGLDQEITASDPNGSNAEQLTGLIEVNAAVQPGESGGPLYNAAGQVVGMNTAGSSARRRSASTDNYAIPINTAVAVAHQIESGKASSTITIGTPGFLGVEIDASAAQATAGATVSDVLAGTPAAKAGIAAGDVITAIDGQAVQTSDTLAQLLQGHHGGDKVTVSWTDSSGKRHTGSVTLIAGPAN